MSEPLAIAPQDAAPAGPQRGATVWLTGLPSAGKSTIAHGCEARAAGPRAARRGPRRRRGPPAPRRRPGLLPRRPRDQHPADRLGRRAARPQRRAGPRLGDRPVPRRARPGPRRARGQRHPLSGGARQHAGRGRGERDVKGLYARQRRRRDPRPDRVDDPYEEPVAPDLVIAAHEHPVDESVAPAARPPDRPGAVRQHRARPSRQARPSRLVTSPVDHRLAALRR